MTVALAFKAFAKAIPCLTPSLATSDPSVLKRILAYIRGLPMHSDELELYHATQPAWQTWDASPDDLSLSLIRQLASLVWRVLHISGRESVYVDHNGHLRAARIAWTLKHRSMLQSFDNQTRN